MIDASVISLYRWQIELFLSKGVNSEEEAAAVIAEVAKNCYTVEQ